MKGFKAAFSGFTDGWIEGSIQCLCASSVVFTIGIALRVIDMIINDEKGE